VRERQELAESIADGEWMTALRALRRRHQRLGATDIATHRAHVTALLRVRSAAPPSSIGDLRGSDNLLDTKTDRDGVPLGIETPTNPRPRGAGGSIVPSCFRNVP